MNKIKRIGNVVGERHPDVFGCEGGAVLRSAGLKCATTGVITTFSYTLSPIKTDCTKCHPGTPARCRGSKPLPGTITASLYHCILSEAKSRERSDSGTATLYHCNAATQHHN